MDPHAHAVNSTRSLLTLRDSGLFVPPCNRTPVPRTDSTMVDKCNHASELLDLPRYNPSVSGCNEILGSLSRRVDMNQLMPISVPIEMVCSTETTPALNPIVWTLDTSIPDSSEQDRKVSELWSNATIRYKLWDPISHMHPTTSVYYLDVILGGDLDRTFPCTGLFGLNQNSLTPAVMFASKIHTGIKSRNKVHPGPNYLMYHISIIAMQYFLIHRRRFLQLNPSAPAFSHSDHPHPLILYNSRDWYASGVPPRGGIGGTSARDNKNKNKKNKNKKQFSGTCDSSSSAPSSVSDSSRLSSIRLTTPSVTEEMVHKLSLLGFIQVVLQSVASELSDAGVPDLLPPHDQYQFVHAKLAKNKTLHLETTSFREMPIENLGTILQHSMHALEFSNTRASVFATSYDIKVHHQYTGRFSSRRLDVSKLTDRQPVYGRNTPQIYAHSFFGPVEPVFRLDADELKNAPATREEMILVCARYRHQIGSFYPNSFEDSLVDATRRILATEYPRPATEGTQSRKRKRFKQEGADERKETEDESSGCAVTIPYMGPWLHPSRWRYSCCVLYTEAKREKALYAYIPRLMGAPGDSLVYPENSIACVSWDAFQWMAKHGTPGLSGQPGPVGESDLVPIWPGSGYGVAKEVLDKLNPVTRMRLHRYYTNHQDADPDLLVQFDMCLSFSSSEVDAVASFVDFTCCSDKSLYDTLQGAFASRQSRLCRLSQDVKQPIRTLFALADKEYDGCSPPVVPEQAWNDFLGETRGGENADSNNSDWITMWLEPLLELWQYRYPHSVVPMYETGQTWASHLRPLMIMPVASHIMRQIVALLHNSEFEEELDKTCKAKVAHMGKIIEENTRIEPPTVYDIAFSALNTSHSSSSSVVQESPVARLEQTVCAMLHSQSFLLAAFDQSSFEGTINKMRMIASTSHNVDNNIHVAQHTCKSLLAVELAVMKTVGDDVVRECLKVVCLSCPAYKQSQHHKVVVDALVQAVAEATPVVRTMFDGMASQFRTQRMSQSSSMSSSNRATIPSRASTVVRPSNSIAVELVLLAQDQRDATMRIERQKQLQTNRRT